MLDDSDFDSLFEDIDEVLGTDLPVDLDEDDVLSPDWDDENDLYGEKLHEGYQ